jgi:hypothetical protein
MPEDILLAPSVRSSKSIGTSAMTAPRSRARRVMSTWKQ